MGGGYIALGTTSKTALHEKLPDASSDAEGEGRLVEGLVSDWGIAALEGRKAGGDPPDNYCGSSYNKRTTAAA
jgi:hypothetical protein